MVGFSISLLMESSESLEDSVVLEFSKSLSAISLDSLGDGRAAVPRYIVSLFLLPITSLLSLPDAVNVLRK